MKLRLAHRSWVVCCALSIACLPAVFLMDSASAEINPNQEKDQRTPEQQKIDSQLLYAIYQMRGEAEAKGVPTEPIPLEKDAKGRVLVDIRVPVTRKVLTRIEKLGGTVLSSSDKYQSIIAYLPLGKVEPLARSREVKFIAPKAQAMTN
ncbi:MAG TPA: hypothetical protein VKB46_26385 [Pyrinomonadaceae bacterium]|nr:hypothetical protein [Pyrinomonadaceae bacterium]